MRRALLLAAIAAGCYHGAPASHDIDLAWRGRGRAELEARWGAPAAEGQDAGQTFLRWTHTRQGVVALPGARGALSIGPGHAEGFAELRAGEVSTTTTDVIAAVDASGRVVEIRGPAVDWGAPDDANLHWGTIFGLHVGMGRLDDTGTPLPSGGLYIGGMLGPRFGLVGSYSLVSGSADAGGAMGMAWAFGAQWFPARRVSLRAGPAMILAFSPGFEDARLRPGIDACASLALIRAGTFALDVRVDVAGAPGVAFGSVGVGVNRD